MNGIKTLLALLLASVDLNKILAGLVHGDPLKQVLAGAVKLEELVAQLLDDVLDKALQKMVDDTSTPFDNAAKAALYPALSKELKSLVHKQVLEWGAAAGIQEEILRALPAPGEHQVQVHEEVQQSHQAEAASGT